ncbi:beta family protein [Helicobacter typhlonius]|uniref:beta family protein n=1 Tax=Helicobacter typhlonius TaxID=76936 RepID=UPI002FE027B8
MDFVYFPILKSRTSELRAYENLSIPAKKEILPIIELTKSRVSKSNPEGSIEKKIEEIKKLLNDNLFILDLTTDDTLKNPQIDKMLFSFENGYAEWVNFIKKITNEYKLNIIPCIHYNPNCIEDVKLQIKQLKENIGDLPLALRLIAKNKRNPEYIEKIKDITKDCILILDGEYSENPLDFNLEAIGEHNFKAIICAYSAFPPTLPDNKKDIEEYKMTEQKEYYLLRKQYPHIFYGDYACTHPIRYDTQARGWLPRIDIPLLECNQKDILYYCRCRTSEQVNTEQAYQKCAKSLFGLSEIKNNLDTSIWGFQVFNDAVNGYVAGKSPSFWISVRMNIYISATLGKLKKIKWTLKI